MNEDLIKAVLMVASGAFGVRLLEMIGKRSEVSMQDAITQRGEWREEVATLRKQVDVLQESVDTWQGKYWASSQQVTTLTMEHQECLHKTESLEKRLAKLEARQ